MESVSSRHRWSADVVERLRGLRRAYRALTPVGLCRCVNVSVGSYAHTVTMVDPFTFSAVDIDVCIATEIAELWHQGIRTMASCCGHGKHPASVSVLPEHDPRMPELGYTPVDPDETPLRWLLPRTGEAGHE